MRLAHFRHAARLGLVPLALVVAACSTPTLPPGAFETALAATVAAGATQIAADFAGQRATLTATAPTATATVPTATFTPTPSDTPTPEDTATPTETATPRHTFTPSPTPSQTRPPPPTATPTLGPATAGTYVQNGACTAVVGQVRWWSPWQSSYQTALGGVWGFCVSSITVLATGELQMNTSWSYNPASYATGLIAGTYLILPWDGYATTPYLVDEAGRRSEPIAREGAARDGGNSSQSAVLTGYYLYPAVASGARHFTLVVADEPLNVISNLALINPTP